MKNLTITLDDETARWARLEAARREMSVSRMIREFLRERSRQEKRYRAAQHRYLSTPAKVLKHAGSYPAREELHDRAGLR